MKKVIVVILVLLGAIIIKIPEYVELNDLAIIETVGVKYNEGLYTIYLKEIIPKKDENGITYDYKYYKSTDKNILKALKNTKTKKKLYLKRVKYLITNLEKSNKTLKELNIKPKSITHTKKNILKVIKAS